MFFVFFDETYMLNELNRRRVRPGKLITASIQRNRLQSQAARGGDADTATVFRSLNQTGEDHVVSHRITRVRGETKLILKFRGITIPEEMSH